MNESIQKRIDFLIDVLTYRMRNPIQGEPEFNVKIGLSLSEDTGILLDGEVNPKKAIFWVPSDTFDLCYASMSLKTLEDLVHCGESLIVSLMVGMIQINQDSETFKLFSTLV